MPREFVILRAINADTQRARLHGRYNANQLVANSEAKEKSNWIVDKIQVEHKLIYSHPSRCIYI